jgi:two-component system LytT family response regulator
VTHMKVLIADDEPLARRGLARDAGRVPGVEIVGECATKDETVTAIVAKRPDVVLLDIRLGSVTAFDVIEQVGVDAMPRIIFVTAFSRYAVRAFDVHAVDYVLKPVDPDRLREAIERAAHLLTLERSPALADRLEQLLADQSLADAVALPGRVAEPLDRLVVRHGTTLGFVDVADIDWIEADGNLVRIHVGARIHPLQTTMARLQYLLGEHRFVRLRRRALVNTRAISTVEPYGKGSFIVTLRTGEKLVSSRYQAAAMRRLLRPLR